jgi:hypothetical protein
MHKKGVGVLLTCLNCSYLQYKCIISYVLVLSYCTVLSYFSTFLHRSYPFSCGGEGRFFLLHFVLSN